MCVCVRHPHAISHNAGPRRPRGCNYLLRLGGNVAAAVIKLARWVGVYGGESGEADCRGESWSSRCDCAAARKLASETPTEGGGGEMQWKKKSDFPF